MQTSFSTILNRITFITRLVLKNENLTLQDIDNEWRYCSLCDGSSINQKLLSRDRERINELFGINIQPRRIESGVYCYYVKNKDDIKDDALLQWHISMLSMVEVMAGYTSLRERIQLENYAPDPHLLPVILQAMKDDKQISITYKRFNGNGTKVHSVEPFFIKDYQHRLYLVARICNKKKDPCVFSLDRILDIERLTDKFKMPKDLTVDKFFEDCYGVMRDEDTKAELVTIRAFDDEMYYVHTKPLHSSQRAIGFLDLSFGFCDFQLYLKPTKDFIGFLLSRADRIEVLEPIWLRKKLQTSLNRSAKLYAEMSASDSPSI